MKKIIEKLDYKVKNYALGKEKAINSRSKLLTIVIKHFILDVYRNPGFTSVFSSIQTECKYLQAFTHKSARAILIWDNEGLLKILSNIFNETFFAETVVDISQKSSL